MKELREVAASALLAVGAVVWLIVVPLMFFQGTLTAHGIGLGSGDPAAASPTFTWASWLGVGIPVVGLVVSATTRRQGWIWFYGIGVVVVAVVAGVRWAQTHPGPPPPPEPTHCVERSGGDNECPGD
ncbi:MULTISPECIES: hypothetical protein [Amycolatopsis]|uniref:Integral membrane protein n=1 Tax=Amycolatopsis bullii TaxID=941987 RepID=A0ABQ3K9N4_9PSEU|nr:hypothetical protein [Amycolatopsis bullii]GHG09553.1 hypothetical protein GCM10017567_28160 [Amycolatopsis bullii]